MRTLYDPTTANPSTQDSNKELPKAMSEGHSTKTPAESGPNSRINTIKNILKFFIYLRDPPPNPADDKNSQQTIRTIIRT